RARARAPVALYAVRSGGRPLPALYDRSVSFDHAHDAPARERALSRFRRADRVARESDAPRAVGPDRRPDRVLGQGDGPDLEGARSGVWLPAGKIPGRHLAQMRRRARRSPGAGSMSGWLRILLLTLVVLAALRYWVFATIRHPHDPISVRALCKSGDIE